MTRTRVYQNFRRHFSDPHKRDMPPTTTPGAATVINSFKPLPRGTPGFEDSLDFLVISKDAPAVKSLAFVRWAPVPPAANAPPTNKVAAPRSLITAALCLGAKVATAPAAIQAWRAAEPLTTRLPVATITRHTQYLHSIGTFSTTFKDQALYRRKLIELLKAQPDLSALELDAADLEQPSPFDQTATVAPPAATQRAGGTTTGRRRGTATAPVNPPTPASAPLVGPACLKFLTMVRASDLFDEESELPAEPLMRLWAMLPDRCSDAERRDPRSRTRANAEVIQAGVAKLTMVASPTDALLGACVNSFARGALKFPLAEFQADELNLNALDQELRDAIGFTQGAEIDVARVVARRLLQARRRYPELISILEAISDTDGRTLQLERLATVACPGRHSQPLRYRLPDLEEFVVARSAAITQARNAGKVGAEIIDLLLRTRQGAT